MNKNTKTPKNGFRIIWFMYVEAFVSLAVLTIGIKFSLIVALSLLAALFYGTMRYFKQNTKMLKGTTYEYSPTIYPFEAILIALYEWPLLARMLVKTIKISKPKPLPRLKHQTYP